jgi:PAS domain S-box-containing protein
MNWDKLKFTGINKTNDELPGELAISVMDSVDDRIFIVDRNYSLIYGNISFIEMVRQYSGSCLKRGESVFTGIPETVISQWKSYFDRIFEQTKEFSVEFESQGIVPKKIYEYHFSPVFNNENKVNNILVIGRDITQLKITEEELKKKESHVRELFMAIPDLIFRIDKNGIFAGYKAAIDDLFYREGDIIGKSVHEIFTSEFASEIVEKIHTVLQTRTIQKLEYQLEIPDRGLRFFEARMGPFGENEVITVVTDITDQKKAKNDLDSSISEFRNLFENAPVGIYRTTPDGKILMANPFLLKMLGFNSIEELAQRDIAKDGYVTDSSRDEFIKKIEQDEVVFGFESKWLTKDKRILSVIENAKAKKDKKGNILWYDGMVQNVSEQKNYEEKLKFERSILRTLIDNIPDAIYFIDKEGKKVIANKADVLNIACESEEAAIGKTDMELFPGEIGLRGHEDNMQLLNTGVPIVNREENFFNKDGFQTWLLTSKFPVYDETKKILGLVGIGHDITRRRETEIKLKESEEKYRLMFETAQEGILVAQDYKMVYFNPVFVELSGFSASELENKLFADMIHPEDFDRVVSNYRKRLSGDLAEQRYEFRMITKSGEVRWISLTGTPMLWNGKPATLNFISDVHQRKLAEDALIESEKALRELNATKDRFFSIIAHDLKSPFNSIVGFSELLKDEVKYLSPDEISNYASVIYNSAKNTLGLLDNLLDWARMQQNRMTFEPKLKVLKQIVDDVFREISTVAQTKSISLADNVPVDIIVNVDENMIKTLIRNLVSNAIKFTNTGGWVRVVAIKEANKVIITVADTGIGISHENMEKLFDIGAGFTTRGTENEKGTGLGLILCKEFASRHGGAISVESETGVGSKFIVELPQNF